MMQTVAALFHITGEHPALPPAKSQRPTASFILLLHSDLVILPSSFVLPLCSYCLLALYSLFIIKEQQSSTWTLSTSLALAALVTATPSECSRDKNTRVGLAKLTHAQCTPNLSGPGLSDPM